MSDKLKEHSDFTQTDILEDFYTSLEDSLEGKASESAIYMGKFGPGRGLLVPETKPKPASVISSRFFQHDDGRR